MFISKYINILSIMKYLTLQFEEKEYEKIKELYDKLGVSWHDFILKVVSEYNNQNIQEGKK